MEQSPSALEVSRNLEVMELESSNPGTSLAPLSQEAASTSRPKQLDTTCTPPPSSTSSAVYSSPRIERMMQIRSTFSTELEFEIESSKDHWSEVAPLSDDSDVVAQDPQSFIEQGILAGEKCTENDLARVRHICDVSYDSIERDVYFMGMLFNRWPTRFLHSNRTSAWELGRKIAEGGEAEIYEAIPGPEIDSLGLKGTKHVLKVFKKGFHVRDLQRLWPKQLATGYSTLYTCPIRYGLLLPHGRFAFMMPRYWGDLRKLLDQRMQERLDCTHRPCTDREGIRSMLYIAKGMRDLHTSNIVHRDLKASNVLVERIEKSESHSKKVQYNEVDTFNCRVADFETSRGVMGTGFWRAPEILLALKCQIPTTLDLFTKASDVYSYAMTCYEIWTGCLPFENLKSNEYDYVLGGGRPILPSGLKPWIREIIERCWHENPLERPTFQEICGMITNCSQDASFGQMDDNEEKEFEEMMKLSSAFREIVSSNEMLMKWDEEKIMALKAKIKVSKEKIMKSYEEEEIKLWKRKMKSYEEEIKQCEEMMKDWTEMMEKYLEEMLKSSTSFYVKELPSC